MNCIYFLVYHVELKVCCGARKYKYSTLQI